jgi:hypothetical protein
MKMEVLLILQSWAVICGRATCDVNWAHNIDPSIDVTFIQMMEI